MMKDLYNCIIDRTVYPILIKNNGKTYLTLHYYTERSDFVLHNDEKRLLCFQSREEMERFCKSNELKIDNCIYDRIYDFDAPISNPIDYRSVLDKWNLLNTIAGTWKMYFEGDSKKYNNLYDLLFRLCTPVEPIDEVYDVGERYLKYILKVFRKKDRFLERFEMYRE